MHYRTKDGDVLDALCHKHYGREAGRPVRGTQTGAVEAVLEANPGLADQGPILPAGLLIILPDLPEPVPHRQPLRLWD